MQPDDIIALAAEIFGVSVEQIKGKSRARHIASVRAALYWVLERVCAEHTMLELAHMLQQRDRKSVYIGLKRCDELMQDSVTYRYKVLELERRTLRASSAEAAHPAHPQPDRLAIWALQQRGSAFVRTA